MAHHDCDDDDRIESERGDYVIDNKPTVLGSGAYGTVVLGRDAVSKRKVAIKVSFDDHDAADALVHEYQLLNNLSRALHARGECLRDHSIVKPRGMFSAEHRMCLALEFCAGGSLDAYLKERGAMREAEIRHVSGQLLAALALLRRVDVVHADFKPANILIVDSEPLDEETDLFSARVRVADFGVAFHMSQVTDEERSGYIGSRPYRPPELMRGQPIGFPADMWALGCVLCEMATGQRLFPVVCDANITQLERIFQLRVDTVLWNSSPAFICLVQGVLQIDPARRVTPEAAARHAFFDAPA